MARAHSIGLMGISLFIAGWLGLALFAVPHGEAASGSDSGLYSLAATPSSGFQLFKVDPATGTVTPLGSPVVGGVAQGISTLDPTHHIYYFDIREGMPPSSTPRLIGVDTQTGAIVTNVPLSVNEGNLEFDPGTTTFGVGATAGDASALALGVSSTAVGTNAIAIGTNSLASGPGDIAIGHNASVNADNSVALGAGATVNPGATNAVALGANSVANASNTVSVGSPGAERRITNVAPGINPTDAATVGQVNALDARVTSIRNQLRAGIAAASALVALSPSAPGKTTVNAATGAFQGEGALGLTVTHWLKAKPSPGTNILLNFGTAVNGHGDVLVRGGVGVEF